MSEEEPIIKIIESAVILGISFLFIQGSIYLGNILNKPVTALISVIGNIIIKTLGSIPIFSIIAIILFIAAGILGLGLLLEDKIDRIIYMIITLFTWIPIGGISLMMPLIPTLGPISNSFIIGFAFLGLIAPPFIYPIMKGILKLLGDI